MSATPAHHVVVVGGGLAGLTAAWQLEQADPSLEVTVLDAAPRTGGKLWSDVFDGHVVDRGADAFLLRTPHAHDLCVALGLAHEEVHPAVREALLLVEGTLRPFPPGLVLGVPTDLEALAASGLVSAAGVRRAAADLAAPDDRPEGDEPVGALVRRRLGDEVYELLVEPLLSGINAGSADELSLEAGAVQLAQAVATQPSLIAGVRALRAAAGGSEAPVFGSLRGGTGALVGALRATLRGRVQVETAVSALQLAPAEGQRRWRVRTSAPDGDATIDADGIVLAAPAFASAPLLDGTAPDAATGLRALRYASVAVVLASWDRSGVEHPLDASGVLVPAREGLLTTACSFGSSKWPHWAGPETVVLRASVGRSSDLRHTTMADAELVAAVLDELRPVLGLHGAPRAAEVVRWPDALPQYAPGHLDRVAAWEEELRVRAPGVVLCGAATRGLGIPAVIAGARAAAQQLLVVLGAQ